MKVEQLLLHIGHGKTGTTSLQRTFARARGSLLDQGVLFPKIHPDDGNALLLGYYLFGFRDADGERQQWLSMPFAQMLDAARQAWSELQRTVVEEGAETLLISSELFFRPMSSSTITSANRQLEQLARTSRVVAYLRAPDGLFLSHYQQMLKQFRIADRPSRTFVRDTIRPLVKHWNGPVMLEVFDRTVMHGGDAVTDFLTRHLPGVTPDSIPRFDDPLNRTLSTEAMAILFEFSSNSRVWRGDKRTLMFEIARADQKTPRPTKPQLRPNVAANVLNWHAPDLYWLRDEMGVVFPSIDYDVIDPDEINDAWLRVGRIEDICDVDPDRKAALLNTATARARLPKAMRRWLAKH